MKFSLAATIVVAVAAQGAIASSWFGGAGAYCETQVLLRSVVSLSSTRD
jgi:hypothetical protein